MSTSTALPASVTTMLLQAIANKNNYDAIDQEYAGHKKPASAVSRQNYLHQQNMAIAAKLQSLGYSTQASAIESLSGTQLQSAVFGAGTYSAPTQNAPATTSSTTQSTAATAAASTASTGTGPFAGIGSMFTGLLSSAGQTIQTVTGPTGQARVTQWWAILAVPILVVGGVLWLVRGGYKRRVNVTR